MSSSSEQDDLAAFSAVSSTSVVSRPSDSGYSSSLHSRSNKSVRSLNGRMDKMVDEMDKIAASPREGRSLGIQRVHIGPDPALSSFSGSKSGSSRSTRSKEANEEEEQPKKKKRKKPRFEHASQAGNIGMGFTILRRDATSRVEEPEVEHLRLEKQSSGGGKSKIIVRDQRMLHQAELTMPEWYIPDEPSLPSSPSLPPPSSPSPPPEWLSNLLHPSSHTASKRSAFAPPAPEYLKNTSFRTFFNPISRDDYLPRDELDRAFPVPFSTNGNLLIHVDSFSSASPGPLWRNPLDPAFQLPPEQRIESLPSHREVHSPEFPETHYSDSPSHHADLLRPDELAEEEFARIWSMPPPPAHINDELEEVEVKPILPPSPAFVTRATSAPLPIIARTPIPFSHPAPPIALARPPSRLARTSPAPDLYFPADTDSHFLHRPVSRTGTGTTPIPFSSRPSPIPTNRPVMPLPPPTSYSTGFAPRMRESLLLRAQGVLSPLEEDDELSSEVSPTPFEQGYASPFDAFNVDDRNTRWEDLAGHDVRDGVEQSRWEQENRQWSLTPGEEA